MKIKIGSFQNLIAWQEAHKLTLIIYRITEKFPNSEKFNLISQMRRAAVSCESCIAEGFYRFHYKDRLIFFYDARGSAGEIQSQIIDAKDLNFSSTEDFNDVMDQTEKTLIVLSGLIRKTEELAVVKK